VMIAALAVGNVLKYVRGGHYAGRVKEVIG
jgi:hypothetical protein